VSSSCGTIILIAIYSTAAEWSGTLTRRCTRYITGRERDKTTAEGLAGAAGAGVNLVDDSNPNADPYRIHKAGTANTTQHTVIDCTYILSAPNATLSDVLKFLPVSANSRSSLCWTRRSQYRTSEDVEK